MKYFICAILLLSSCASAYEWHLRDDDDELKHQKVYLVHGKTSEKLMERDYFTALDTYWENDRFTLEFVKDYIITHWTEAPEAPVPVYARKNK